MEHESARVRIRMGFVGAFSCSGADRRVEHSMLARQTLQQLLGAVQIAYVYVQLAAAKSSYVMEQIYDESGGRRQP
ncbi:hypothetical protein [Dyella nitratireducens]|uniref:Uncharacterized protein n=1 Tax=Dyella nitratireducens TaxID=1849580 RepID=A0ABQ1GMN7_9GAMM|nr:hypothetical protein [Dyella nitratireducens]GGA46443.1 hypothetical protein GCM10010981_39480 [Dyella nitratireducens]GLQ41450.1 hypothetical protein GCM10007902_13000 [Dyella nitratireducens]